MPINALDGQYSVFFRPFSTFQAFRPFLPFIVVHWSVFVAVFLVSAVDFPVVDSIVLHDRFSLWLRFVILVIRMTVKRSPNTILGYIKLQPCDSSICLPLESLKVSASPLAQIQTPNRSIDCSSQTQLI